MAYGISVLYRMLPQAYDEPRGREVGPVPPASPLGIEEHAMDLSARRVSASVSGE